jgi:hypothetical protein
MGSLSTFGCFWVFLESFGCFWVLRVLRVLLGTFGYF